MKLSLVVPSAKYQSVASAVAPRDKPTFHFDNVFFEPGSSEVYYGLIRLLRPRRIVEVGSGMSSLLAIRAVRDAAQVDRNYSCRITCIEPYERPWLEQTGVEVERCPVETLSPRYFQTLEPNDILFIDSSHVIRPQGDVLFLLLTVLPSLPFGVFVHIHDIFTPRDYPERWVCDKRRFWNEQYLVEALLTSNPSFRIVAALNYLCHNHRDALERACPQLARTPREPSSLWLRRC